MRVLGNDLGGRLAAMTVRQLTATDWADLWPMLQDFGTGLTEAAAQELYLDLLTDTRWALFGYEESRYDESARLVGYAAVQDYGPHLRAGRRHHGRLHDLYVWPDQRRLGVGRALVQAVTEWAAERLRYLEWQAHHERSAPFYERLGYRGQPCPQPDYPTFEIDFSA
jgi:GNAT superfamily N-acetyltransferase